ncbi:MAG: NAD(P)H-dependent oxidoreductase subunit E [Chloroflexi bacterium]|nr:NAD(P)H-dependent oxidoreductase subunit E [Chloroflexota bacterium]MCA2000595.1 NAD(P)H-dependent oxidoreductase subunit E [Chloroflexota bacterium]
MSSLISESEIAAAVQAAVEKHGKNHDALIPILSEVNRAFGYVPGEAIREIRKHLYDPANRTYVAEGQLYALASFYDMLSTKPRGRHVIKFCENAPCHVVGGKAIWDTLRQRLNLENGETTPDFKWTLVTTSCIGLCSVGPVILIDDDIYGNLTPEQIPDILERYE